MDEKGKFNFKICKWTLAAALVPLMVYVFLRSYPRSAFTHLKCSRRRYMQMYAYAVYAFTRIYFILYMLHIYVSHFCVVWILVFSFRFAFVTFAFKIDNVH